MDIMAAHDHAPTALSVGLGAAVTGEKLRAWRVRHAVTALVDRNTRFVTPPVHTIHRGTVAESH